MRVLVTGALGQLGRDVMEELDDRNCGAVGTGRAPSTDEIPYIQMDVTDAGQVERAFQTVRPEAVIHCAAWTAVDAAEDRENRAAVYAVNGLGTENLARACANYGSKLLYLSTDYVFNGQGTEPWEPDCKAFGPLNVYGQSKLQGEQAVAGLLERYFIVRIAWAFGAHGKNFVRTMLQAGKTHESVRVVNDQIGTPTYTRDLARLLADMVASEAYGCYHATNEGGYISWYDFTCEIYRQAGVTARVLPITTEEYGAAKAIRPRNSRLEKRKLVERGFRPLPDWRDALSRYLKEIGE